MWVQSTEQKINVKSSTLNLVSTREDYRVLREFVYELLRQMHSDMQSVKKCLQFA